MSLLPSILSIHESQSGNKPGIASPYFPIFLVPAHLFDSELPHSASADLLFYTSDHLPPSSILNRHSTSSFRCPRNQRTMYGVISHVKPFSTSILHRIRNPSSLWHSGRNPPTPIVSCLRSPRMLFDLRTFPQSCRDETASIELALVLVAAITSERIFNACRLVQDVFRDSTWLLVIKAHCQLSS